MSSRIPVNGPSVLKGTFSHAKLKQLGVAVVDSKHPILCCTACEDIPYRILQYDKCASHVQAHMRGIQNCDSDDDVGADNDKGFIMRNNNILSLTAINKILNEFEFWTGPLWEIPPPDEIVAPFSFLPIHNAYRCLLCGAALTLKRSAATMRTHLIDSHGSSEGFDTKTMLVKVQSYSEVRNYRKDFMVDPSLALAEQHAHEVGPDADPAALARAWRVQTNPTAEIRAPKAVNIKTAPPFVVRSGWGVWVNGLENLPNLRALAHGPYEKEEERIHKKAIRIFSEDHAKLSNVALIFRKRITMSEGEKDSQPLECKLEASTVLRYGSCWASLIIFVIRVLRHQEAGQYTVPVIFTDDQRAWIKSLINAGSKKQPKWRNLLYGLSRFLWWDTKGFAHTTKDQFVDATTAFSVLFCMRSDLTFARTNDITHDLNALRFSMQQVFLFWAIQFQESAADKVQISIDWLQDTLQQELDKTRHGPFATLMNTYSIASNLSRTAEGMPNFYYQGKADTAIATLGNKSIPIKLWREGIRQMLSGFEDFVSNDLLLGLSPADLGFNFGPEKVLVDNFSRRDAGYSFLTEVKNPFRDWTYSLASRMFANPRAAKMFEKQRDAKGNVVLRDLGVDQWLVDYSYGIRGQPSRGAEFVLVRLINDGWRVRNVYMMRNGRLAIVLFYTKVSSMTGKDRVVAYCVPWRITRLFIIIYGLIHPFVQQLLEVLLQGEAADDARRTHQVYMFALRGKAHTSAQLSEDLRSFYNRTCGEEFGVRDNRHFMIGVMRHETPLSKGPAERALALIDLQAGHGSAVAGAYYAVEASAAHELTNEQLSGFFICSLVWYSFVMGDSRDSLTPEDISDIERASRPGGHPAITGAELYPLAAVNPEARDAAISTMITRALDEQKAAILADTAALVSSQLVAFEARMAANEKKHQPPPAPSVEYKHKSILWRYVGKMDAQWASTTQSRALTRICDQQSSVLVVLPTGGGKSLLFIGPAFDDKGITIVICPFLSLIANHVDAATKAGVQSHIYSPELQNTFGTGLVFVIIEHAVSVAFRTWVVRLIHDQRLHRIVFDEAHEALLAKSYREKVTELQYLCSLGVPLVMLTATLPPSLEEDLKRAMGCPTFAVERTGTQRHNIAYRWAEYKTEPEMLAGLRTHLQAYEGQLVGTENILVMCRSRDIVDILTKEYPGSGSYHSGLADDVRLMNMERYMSGKTKIMFATSGFGTGLHKEDVRVVIHLDKPYGLMSYAQESGRAGRDNKPALSIIMSVYKKLVPPNGNDAPRLNGWDQVVQMSTGKCCFRKIMSSWYEGADQQVTCAGYTSLPCCVCKAEEQAAMQRVELGHAQPPTYLDAPRFHPILRSKDLVEQFIPREANMPSAAPVYRAPLAYVNSQSAGKPSSVSLGKRPTDPSQELRDPVAGGLRRHAIPRPANIVIAPQVESTLDGIQVLSLSDDDDKITIIRQENSQSEPADDSGIKQPGSDPSIHSVAGPSNQPRGPGALVLLDAAVAKSRQIPVSSQQTRSLDDKLSICLQAAYKWMRGRCALCAIIHGAAISHGHTLADSKNIAAGECQNDIWSLLQYKDDSNQTWGNYRRTSWNLPSHVQICFTCGWPQPFHNMGGCQREQVGQICWLVWSVDEYKKQLFRTFRLGEAQESGSGYVQWLVKHNGITIAPPGGGKSYGQLNAYRVVVWALYQLKGYLKP